MSNDPNAKYKRDMARMAQLKTRNERGAKRMADRGQKLPAWMLGTRTLDGLFWWQFHVGWKKRNLGSWQRSGLIGGGQ